jgi:hypothetical protein
MAGNNTTIIKKAFEGYAEHIDKIVYSKLDKWCVEILRSAIRSRMSEPNGHNFTGNLINSICVLLYRKSNGRLTRYFGYDKAGLKLPIRREFSGITSRHTRRKNRIWLRPDWSGGQSVLKGSGLIGTDESFGQNDAVEFSNHWLPSNPNCDFIICVAYTSEYASFVEYERGTTGIMQTESWVAHTAIEWVGLKAA